MFSSQNIKHTRQHHTTIETYTSHAKIAPTSTLRFVPLLESLENIPLDTLNFDLERDAPDFFFAREILSHTFLSAFVLCEIFHSWDRIDERKSLSGFVSARRSFWSIWWDGNWLNRKGFEGTSNFARQIIKYWFFVCLP